MKQYEKCLSVDLRCFDNSLPDYGVDLYLDLLGFVPDRLFNHETYVDQLHTHNGIIDDTFLEPQWTSQRAIPGVQRWTRRQFHGLVRALHNRGILVYQGAEAAWNYWPEYGEINRCDYTYQNLSCLFITHADGRTSEQERGCINPLKRLPDGTWYEDLLIRDLLRFLRDYEMDGFFAADGFAGLDCPLTQGDFSLDMIEQFEAWAGISVPRLPTPELSRWILDNERSRWTEFYAARWEAFYRKLTAALYADGRDLAIFSPWTEGPADSLMDFGIDYGRLSRAGVRTMCLEVMEEVIGRRWHNEKAWEITGITAAVTAKLQAPDLQILWTAATANIPEHWHTFRDAPQIIRREALALGSAGVFAPDGSRRGAFDGFLTIFGIDLTHEDWRFFKDASDLGFSGEETANRGLCLLWSDSALYEHVRRGERWNVREAVAQLHFSGVPVQCGCPIEAMHQASAVDAFLLVDPIGLSEEEILALEQAVDAGARLVIIGRVEHPRLLKLLGLKPSDEMSLGRWSVTDPSVLWLQGVPETEGPCTPDTGLAADGACVLIADGKRILAGRTEKTLYLGEMRRTFSPFAMPKNDAEINCNRPVFPRQEEPARSLRECALALAMIHPESLELALARCVYAFLPQLPRVDKGQYFCIQQGEKLLLSLENAALAAYCVTECLLPQGYCCEGELPDWRLGPLGYQYWYPDPERLFAVIPPDGCVPYRLVPCKSNGFVL